MRQNPRTRNILPTRSVEKLAQDIQQEPDFHANNWETMKGDHPELCTFIEMRLADVFDRNTDAVDTALTVFVEAEVLRRQLKADSGTFSQFMQKLLDQPSSPEQ